MSKSRPGDAPASLDGWADYAIDRLTSLRHQATDLVWLTGESAFARAADLAREAIGVVRAAAALRDRDGRRGTGVWDGDGAGI